MTFSDFRKFLACVLIWGTTWLTITFQLGAVPPEFSVAWRFFLAAAILSGFCFWRGFSLRLPLALHRHLLALGATMFGIGYLLVYYAEGYIASGLVAIGYCVCPLTNQIAARLAFGTPISRRVSWGGVVGAVGVACVFWPELAQAEAGGGLFIGAALTAAGVACNALGNVCATRLEREALNVWQKMAWSMAYGALCCLLFGLARGQWPTFSLAPAYLLSLLYLAVFGSVVAFYYYLRLLESVGAGRAGYVGVMTPMVALVLSALFEHFAWSWLTWLGLAVSLAGNVLILLPARPAQRGA